MYVIQHYQIHQMRPQDADNGPTVLSKSGRLEYFYYLYVTAEKADIYCWSAHCSNVNISWADELYSYGLACFTAIKQQSLFPVPFCTLQNKALCVVLSLQNVHWYFCFIISSVFYTVRTVSKLVAVECTAMCPWNLNSNIDIFKITCS